MKCSRGCWNCWKNSLQVGLVCFGARGEAGMCMGRGVWMQINETQEKLLKLLEELTIVRPSVFWGSGGEAGIGLGNGGCRGPG